MDRNNYGEVKTEKDHQDIMNAVNMIVALQQQVNHPTREGMIRALSDAQSVAGDEIRQIEDFQGDTIPMPWSCFLDHDLYRKLSQYQEGLRQHCIKKVGQKALEELLKEADDHSEFI